MAVTSTTLELLAKKDPRELQAVKPQLDRIFRANYTMRQLTEGLLWLWREPSQPLATQATPYRGGGANMANSPFNRPMTLDIAPDSPLICPCLAANGVGELLKNA